MPEIWRTCSEENLILAFWLPSRNHKIDQLKKTNTVFLAISLWEVLFENKQILNNYVFCYYCNCTGASSTAHWFRRCHAIVVWVDGYHQGHLLFSSWFVAYAGGEQGRANANPPPTAIAKSKLNTSRFFILLGSLKKKSLIERIVLPNEKLWAENFRKTYLYRREFFSKTQICKQKQMNAIDRKIEETTKTHKINLKKIYSDHF